MNGIVNAIPLETGQQREIIRSIEVNIQNNLLTVCEYLVFYANHMTMHACRTLHGNDHIDQYKKIAIECKDLPLSFLLELSSRSVQVI